MKKNKASTLLSDPHKTYANKLDEFMISTNSKFNGTLGKKSISSFIDTGLPENVVETENNHNENKSGAPTKVSNKKVTETQ